MPNGIHKETVTYEKSSHAGEAISHIELNSATASVATKLSYDLLPCTAYHQSANMEKARLETLRN